ncbi:hypothetical protein QOT17_000071 [Balamuthia mandrillaris]
MAQYGEPFPESGLRNSFVKQMEQKLAYTEQLGLFYTQQFLSAFVVAARHIPEILCSLKIAQEVENAQERLQLTKAEPPSLEMLQQTRKRNQMGYCDAPMAKGRRKRSHSVKRALLSKATQQQYLWRHPICVIGNATKREERGHSSNTKWLALWEFHESSMCLNPGQEQHQTLP